MNKIRIGILGAGYIAGVHAAILANDDRVELTTVYDAVTDCANKLAGKHAMSVAGTAGDVIDRCDAIYITTPNTRHVALSLAAAAEHKHVFCEKPLATNVADAEAVVQKVSRSRGIFQVGHNRRFAPVYATLKKMLSETHAAHSAHVKMNRGELLKPVWTGDPHVTGGFLYETTIHMFDMLRFLFGEVDSLFALGSTHEYNEVDDFSVLFKFVSGMHATLASSADASWLFPFERVEVFCHHATIFTREMESIGFSTNAEGHSSEQSMQQLTREEKWGYLQEDRAFIEAILNQTPPLVTAFDGLMSVELVNAVYESVASGAPVSVKRHA